MKTRLNVRRALVLAVLLTGLQSARAYYDPGAQRWINRDPVAERGGMNLYRFVNNDPLVEVDPDGQESEQAPPKKPPPTKTPPKKPKPKNPPAKPKCTTCEDLLARLNKVKGHENRKDDENWKADCYLLCAHIYAKVPRALKQCYENCEEGYPPSASCYVAPPIM